MEAKKFITRILKSNITSTAGEIAYFMLIALFPFLILLIKLASIVSVSRESVLNILYHFLPESAYLMLERNLEIVSQNMDMPILSLGALVILWSASKGMHSLRRSLDWALSGEDVPLLRARLFSLVATIAFALVLVVALLFTLSANLIMAFLVSRLTLLSKATIFWTVLAVAIPFLVGVLIFMVIYKFLPSVRPRFKTVIPGSIVSATGCVIFSAVFSIYANYYANYSKLYGALASVFALIVWLYINSVVILFGGQINGYFHEIEQRKVRGKKKEPS